jgi:hypothetical protein
MMVDVVGSLYAVPQLERSGISTLVCISIKLTRGVA